MLRALDKEEQDIAEEMLKLLIKGFALNRMDSEHQKSASQ